MAGIAHMEDLVPIQVDSVVFTPEAMAKDIQVKLHLYLNCFSFSNTIESYMLRKNFDNYFYIILFKNKAIEKQKKLI